MRPPSDGRFPSSRGGRRAAHVCPICTDLERTPNLSGPSVKVLLWGPFRQTGSLVGRSTRALFEWDTPRTRACVLKDTWRFVEGDAMAQKSEVVETLHRRQVPDIPGLISKDDVEGEDALTHFSPDWVAVTKSKGWGSGMHFRRHRCLLLDFIPRFLEQFRPRGAHHVDSGNTGGFRRALW